MKTIIGIIIVCLISQIYCVNRAFAIKDEINVDGEKHYSILFKNSCSALVTNSIDTTNIGSYLYLIIMNSNNYVYNDSLPQNSINQRFKNYLLDSNGINVKGKYYFAWHIEVQNCNGNSGDYGNANIKFFYCLDALNLFVSNYLASLGGTGTENAIKYDGTLAVVNLITTQFCDDGNHLLAYFKGEIINTKTLICSAQYSSCSNSYSCGGVS